MSNGYNVGDTYEGIIHRICVERNITPQNFGRGGAGSAPDVKFIHGREEQNLEVKKDLRADYGQKMLRWSNGVWRWSIDDEVTSFYTAMGALGRVQSRNIIPRRYTVDPETFTLEDKRIDQRAFEDNISIPTSRLYVYYATKNCHYIQIGGYGFYCLDRDILGLGVPQFNGTLRLRFRAKTIRSEPVWNYAFYAVLKIATNPLPTQSPYDIEELDGRSFPPITP